jgi:crotonobetainyl-CoA:carnitine CoA-transferase CaiB-like acyl-CoA transferase
LQNATDRIDARTWTVPKAAARIELWDLPPLTEILDQLNIPFARINAPEDMFADPHVLRQGGLVSATNVDGKTFRAPALPLEINGQGIGADLVVPKLGADTETVLAELVELSGGLK